MSSTRCERCGAVDPDRDHLTGCEAIAAAQQRVVAHAATLDRPPKDAALFDLLAHIATTDRDRDAQVVETVLDLGWRPVIGGTT